MDLRVMTDQFGNNRCAVGDLMHGFMIEQETDTDPAVTPLATLVFDRQFFAGAFH